MVLSLTVLTILRLSGEIIVRLRKFEINEGNEIMKLLLIMPRFFNYPELITEELKNMGYEVDFFDDRPSTNAWVKAAIRINKSLISVYIKKYFDEVMKTVRNKEYNVVFLISGQ